MLDDIVKFYTIAQKEMVTYGHGHFKEELHIKPIFGKGDNTVYPPLFVDKSDAEEHLRKKYFHESYKVVQLEIYKKES